MGSVTATTARDTSSNPFMQLAACGALVGSGFRRYATYRQATVAGAFTNTVFGFLRCYVLLAVAAGAGGVAAGYRPDQLATYVWFGQGMIAVVMLWGPPDLAERIRTGEVATDLLRPIHPVLLYLATDLGRAGHALLFRFLPPVLVGALIFDLYLPGRPGSWPLFAVSAVLAVVIYRLRLGRWFPGPTLGECLTCRTSATSCALSPYPTTRPRWSEAAPIRVRSSRRTPNAYAEGSCWTAAGARSVRVGSAR